ncbi:flagellin [Galbitalea soli]|uniref:Flagellin n=1 Tax=Galbitalea soli TaxID=1268042 RepID=A0A7C9PMZ9_9MICO|nr:flagellin [Galbitalea soli]NEM91166.1 flagellin [Galbitalea soli]NYJ29855.1 flagellin [Galbitalea soli]
MALSVTTNIAAMNAYRNLSNTQNSISSSMEKLSSGLRINRAADDAAGLAISEGLKSQVNGLTVASRNAQDGINVVQTAEGALNEVQSILQRVRDLSVQAANDSNSTDSRAAIQTEVTQLGSELTRLSTATDFNGTKLLDGSASALKFQVGANGSADNVITVDLSSANVGAIGTAVSALTFTDNTAAQASITAVDAQLKTVSTARATLGAVQNRFQHTINSVNIATENLSAAASTITSTDMAKEMVNFTKAQVLSQAGTAMLAQANQLPQSILKLLQ